MTRDKTFLTENRRDVLTDDCDWSTQAVRNERSRIKNLARIALAELIEVAESQEIDTRDVFDPDDVFNLLQAILLPDGYVGPYYPSSDAPDEWLAYHYRIQIQLQKLVQPAQGSIYEDADQETETQ
jgi:hypothetical protein